MISFPLKEILVFISAGIIILHYLPISIPTPIPQIAITYVTLFALANALPNIRPQDEKETKK